MSIGLMRSALLGAASLFAANTAAAGDDAVKAQIKRQIDAFSEASDRQDQAVMGRMVDDRILFSNGSGAVYGAVALRSDSDAQASDEPDAVSALLKRKTQAFIDASQRGDLAAMRSNLGQDVLFTDEDGVLARRGRDVRGAIAPPRGAASKITVTDWAAHHAGDVAVATFIDDQRVRYGGQTVNYQFRAVETWVKREGRWRLIASQTIPFHRNPPTAELSLDALGDYVGDYSDGQGLTVSISKDGEGLAASTNGAKASALLPEARDLFFRPLTPADGQPGYARPRVVFRRDATGRVAQYLSRGLVLDRCEVKAPPVAGQPDPASTLTLRDLVVHRTGDVAVAAFLHDRATPYFGHVLKATYRSTETFVLRDGAWKMLASQGRELQPDPPAAVLPPDALNDYVGAYAAGPGLVVSISRAGDALSASLNGGKVVRLDAVARDIFFTPGAPRACVLFQRDAGGRVSGYQSRRDERDVIFTKT